MADDQATIATLKKLIAQKAEVDKKFAAGLRAGDTKAVAQYAALAESIKNADTILREYNEALEEHRKIDADSSKSLKEKTAAQEKLVKSTLDANAAVASLNDTETKAIAKAKELSARQKDVWQNTTLLGKAYSATSGILSSYAAKLGFVVLAGKALARTEEAARLRQTLIIKGYQDMSKEATTFSKAGAASILEYEAALRRAQTTAILLGVDTGEVATTMEKFSRIVGSNNPKALGEMSEAAIAVSKELGIDVAEATEYVSTRMDKFGGSATGALLTLHNLRKGSEDINKVFGATVIRADDVSRTLIEIGRNESIYAMDQRAVSNVLKDNIARLQAMGESYDQAYKKAKLFTEGITEKAPQWMKLLSGQNIMGQLGDELKKAGGDVNKFMKSDFAAALDKAKPGLSKKVADIFKNPNLSDFDKSKLIQEVTQGTKVGMNSINDQLLNLAHGAGKNAVSVISQQFSVTEDQAYSMIQSAEAQRDMSQEVLKVKSQINMKGAENNKQLLAALGMSKQEFELDKKQGRLDDDGIETILRQNKLDAEGLEYKKANQKLEGKAKEEAVGKLKAQIKSIELEEKHASKGQKALLEARKQELEVKLADTLGKVDEQQLDVLKQIRDGIVTRLPKTPGDIIKAKVNELSSPKALLTTGIIVGALKTAAEIASGGAILGTVTKIWSKFMGGGKAAAAAAEMGEAGVAGAATAGGEVAGAEIAAVGGAEAATGGAAAGAGILGGTVLPLAAAGAAGVGLGYGAYKAADYATGGKYSETVGAPGAWLASKMGPSDAEIMQQAQTQVQARRAAMPGSMPTSAAPTAQAGPATAAATGGATAGHSGQPGSKTGSQGQVTGQVGALQPDGSVMVKLVNFMDAIGQGMVAAKSQVPRGASK